jgi:hypothetical protein
LARVSLDINQGVVEALIRAGSDVATRVAALGPVSTRR